MAIKTIGILGGMGPEATWEFYGKILNMTSAAKDQEHIPCIIFSNTQVPDRTESILKGDGNAMKVLQDSAAVLEEAGADFIVIPCNTAHYWISDVRKAVKIPVVDMIEETAKHMKMLGCRRIGLLATTGTVRTSIYDDAFRKYGMDILKPERQETVMKVITRVKAGDTSHKQRKIIGAEIAKLEKAGVKNFVLGCTELPLVFRGSKPRNVTDPMDVLAARAIELAGKKPKIK